MKIIKVKNYEEMSDEILKIFVEQIKNKKNSILSFTTGATPREFLLKFTEEINKGLDISQCKFFNLDEYVGKKDKQYSVYSFMKSHLYDLIKSQPKEIHMMNAEAEDKQAEIERYRKLLEENPRDIQLLGLGINGHIGANEPVTSFNSTLFVADSHKSTIEATKNLFNLTFEETPTQMFTMGFKEIMEAKCVILAASGIKKADAVKKIIEGKITEEVPASILKKHSNFIFIIDKEAASLLKDLE